MSSRHGSTTLLACVCICASLLPAASALTSQPSIATTADGQGLVVSVPEGSSLTVAWLDDDGRVVSSSPIVTEKNLDAVRADIKLLQERNLALEGRTELFESNVRDALERNVSTLVDGLASKASAADLEAVKGQVCCKAAGQDGTHEAHLRAPWSARHCMMTRHTCLMMS